MDPTKINNIGISGIEESNTEFKSYSKERKSQQLPKDINEFTEAPMREISFKESQNEEEEDNISNTQSYQKANDYVHYGLDYVGISSDPQKVDTNLPVVDYVYQLL